MNFQLITRKLTGKHLLLSLSLGIVFPLISGLGAVTFAQTAADLQTIPSNDNERDATLGTFNPMDMIHMMMLNNGRSMEEFMLDSRIEMDAATDDFKLRQQEMLLNGQSEKENDGVVELE